MGRTSSRSSIWSGSIPEGPRLTRDLADRESEHHQRDRAEEENLDSHRQANPPDRHPGALPALVAVTGVLLERCVAAVAVRLARLSADRGPCHPSRLCSIACSGAGPRAPARARPPGPRADPAGPTAWSRPEGPRDP